ncbi:DEAD/DEAH box helicase family protein [Cryptosporidium felis]|nr:DEAD/DEAH box helicase family protein [Cryptosporidium felis]
MKEPSKNKSKVDNKYNDSLEVKTLRNRVLIELPNSGNIWKNPNATCKKKEIIHDTKRRLVFTEIEDVLSLDLFSDLPISRRTLEGLRACEFYQMTLIQKNTIPHSLRGRDIIGQARTGSGKTLAFVIPILENLYRNGYCSLDGLLALILIPTRELASQVFDVIKDVGRFHSTLSAGCIVGGKDVRSEATRINLLNILVATPGRLIQHMDESPLWDANNLKILVVDEVDRMLDMGFLNDIGIILDGIPSPNSGRQTMVFSATIDLPVLSSLKTNNKLFRIGNIENFSLDNGGELPKLIDQLYIKVAIHEKMDTLFNFLRTHNNKKIIVFVSCCKQVRFLSTVFTKLKMGCRVLELHGKQSLQKRLEVVHKFHIHENAKHLKYHRLSKNNSGENSKSSNDGAILFCTDIASRGLDFPKIDWVVQLDIPENVDTYIHRIGRTARYISKGKSLLFVMPNEDYFVKNVYSKGIYTIKKVVPKNYEMRFTIHSLLESLCASDKTIREMAEKSFSAYIKSLFILTPHAMHDELKSLDFSAFALSLGLSVPPNITINSKEQIDNKTLKHPSKLQKFKEKMRQKKISNQFDTDHGLELEEIDSRVTQNKIDNTFLTINKKPTVKSEDLDCQLVQEKFVLDKLRFRSDHSGKIRGQMNSKFAKQHLFFSDEDSEETEKGIVNQGSNIEEQDIYIRQVRNRLKSQIESDKERDRNRVHELHVKRRRFSREQRRQQSGSIDEVILDEEGCGIQIGSPCENNIHNLTVAALEKLGINNSANTNYDF